MPVEPDVLKRALDGLHGDGAPDFGIELAIQQIVEAADSVMNVAGTGLMLIDETQALKYVAASDEPGQILEVAQEESGEGPCVDALIHGTITTCDDLANDERYQRLAPIVAPNGVRAVIGIPVHVGGTPAGSFNAYANKPHHWDESEADALSAFTRVLESTLDHAIAAHRQSSVVEQLEFALENRVTIERAIGLLMGRHDLDVNTAFNRLRKTARSERRKVKDLAADVLMGAPTDWAARPAEQLNSR